MSPRNTRANFQFSPSVTPRRYAVRRGDVVVARSLSQEEARHLTRKRNAMRRIGDAILITELDT